MAWSNSIATFNTSWTTIVEKVTSINNRLSVWGLEQTDSHWVQIDRVRNIHGYEMSEYQTDSVMLHIVVIERNNAF